MVVVDGIGRRGRATNLGWESENDEQTSRDRYRWESSISGALTERTKVRSVK